MYARQRDDARAELRDYNGGGGGRPWRHLPNEAASGDDIRDRCGSYRAGSTMQCASGRTVVMLYEYFADDSGFAARHIAEIQPSEAGR